ncbi:MAG: DNA-binding protein WhiA, partial [Clostridiales bacterium]|nr:DNA-binding protein WhiA [Clostridiales bacterium]
EKDYHLEFVVPYMNLSKSMVKLMSELDLEPKTAKRSGYTIIYFKESESIEACLYRMGAHKAAFDIMNIKVVKDFRNKANRMANCETANINRIVGASAQQLQAIEQIYEKTGPHYLSEELQEIAALRLANPEASLQELAELTAGGLSRSGVNHRLKKIETIAEEL